jgi:hypothetical protein
MDIALLPHYLTRRRRLAKYRAVTTIQRPQQSKPTLSWQLLSGRDSGERWTLIWDTKRRPGNEGRNTAVEKFEQGALDRARHLLRMDFVVYETRDPSGAVFLEEGEIRRRLDIPVAAS